jgi:hypothetical protein
MHPDLRFKLAQAHQDELIEEAARYRQAKVLAAQRRRQRTRPWAWSTLTQALTRAIQRRRRPRPIFDESCPDPDDAS